MKNLWVKISLGLFLLTLFSCSATQEEKISFHKPFFRVQKNASMDQPGSFVKDGMTIYGAQLIDQAGNIKKAPEALDTFEIIDPNGNEFDKIVTLQLFAINSRKGGNGYQVSGFNDKYVVWLGVSFLTDMVTPPASGKYTFRGILKSGKKIEQSLEFEALKQDPIKGYPEKIIYDEKTRTISWKGTEGQTGYKISVFRGIKENRPDPAKLVFSSTESGLIVEDVKYSLPQEVAFEAGEPYYITVDALYSKTGKIQDVHYLHSQDIDAQIAVFTPQKAHSQSAQQIIPIALKDVPYPFPVKYLQTKSGKIAYINEGQGQSILMIHGVSTDLNSFYMLYNDLIANGFNVVAIDLLGYGKSAKPKLNHTLALHAKTVMEVVKKLNLKSPILFGHSMGGAVAIAAALENQKLLKGLILLTPGGTYPYPEMAGEYIKANYESQFGARYSKTEVAKNYYQGSVHQTNEALEKFIELRLRTMLHPDWQEVQKAIKNSSISYTETNNTLAAQLEKIKIPVLAIYAGQDKTIKPDLAQANITSKNLQWTVKIIKDCGHMVQYDKKHELLAILKQYLKTLQ